MNSATRLVGYFCVLSLYFASNVNYSLEPSDSNINIDADKVEYVGTDKNRLIKAWGDVYVTQDKKKLVSQNLEYNFDKDILSAEKDVQLFEEEGYIVNADKIVLYKKMDLGWIRNFKILTPEKSTLYGRLAKKEEKNIIEIEDGSFTSCQICKNKKTPWIISAKKAKLNEETGKVVYKNTIVKYYGVPILYFPYFVHYTKKAERKSGFLTPEYGGNSYIGTSVRIPFYVNIAPNQDATLKLLATKKRGFVFEGQHRYLSKYGQVESFLTTTSDKKYSSTQGQKNNDIRYNFKSKTDLYVSPYNSFGWNINQVSDKSYKKDYGYGDEDYTMSRLYNKAYQDSGYYQVQTIFFQNLRSSNDSNTIHLNQTPMILPLFETKHVIKEFSDGSNLSLESSMLKVNRYEGPESARISLKNSWNKHLLLDSGNDFNFFISLRQDFYKAKNYSNDNENQSKDKTRTIPEAGVDWQLPLYRRINNDFTAVISPTINAIITPNVNYNDRVPNEDSNNIAEINDINIFAKTRYSGIDKVENTSRVGYGIRGELHYKQEIKFKAMIGQLYRQKPEEIIYGAAEDKVSDYIGRLQFDYKDMFGLSYRYKVDKDNFSNKSNEIEALLKYQEFYMLTNMLYYKDDLEITELKNRREIYLEGGFNNYNQISASMNARKNFTSNLSSPSYYGNSNGIISWGGKLKYHQECVTYSFEFNKDYTSNKDKKAITTFWFGVNFKNLG